MTERRRQVLIGAGANLGDRGATLRAAADRLRAVPGVQAFVGSAVYETEPVGVTAQPKFLNAVFGLETTLEPEVLLARVQAIEQEFGRVRTQRWGPRTLDLDLLAFEGEVRTTPSLLLPHPRMLERAFVVVPLRDVLREPAFHRPAWDELRAAVAEGRPDESGVHRVGPLEP